MQVQNVIFGLLPLFSFSSLAITGLSAGFVNASTLSVSWDAASPSEKVSGYDVIIMKEAAVLRRIGVDNITSSINTSSLDQCRNYTVKVAANSTVGPGNYSTLDLVTKCGKSPGMAITSFHELFKRLKIAVKTLSKTWKRSVLSRNVLSIGIPALRRFAYRKE